MSIATLILGESGTGKSTSLRHFNPEDVLLIQAIRKPLPFRSADWKRLAKRSHGSVYVCDNANAICAVMQKTQRNIIVIDDFQYIMANEFMRGVGFKYQKDEAYQRFNHIGRNAWQIFDLAGKLPEHKRVYILSHTQSDDLGRTKIKTIGKMLDEKITLEGMVTICLRTNVQDGQYRFTTQNNGQDTVKAPLGLFAQNLIENDLAMVDRTICDYYGIPHSTSNTPEGN